MRRLLALVVLASVVNAGSAQGGTSDGAPKTTAPKTAAPAMKPIDAPAKTAEVKGARVHSAELLGAGVVDVDLGPSPPVGSARVIERAEIERAYETAGATLPKKLPTSVRVTRKTRRLAPGEVANLVRAALSPDDLKKGAALQNVHASGVEVPADFDHVTVALASLPRRSGVVSVTANVGFLAGDGTVQMRSLVPVELVLPPEAALPDIARGQSLTLVVRRGLVEVALGAVASGDADVGSVLQVTIKASGRSLRARAIDKDHVLALEDS